MRKLLFFVIVLFFSCRGEKRYEDNTLTDYQKKQNEFFKDASRSPLKAVDLKNFKGLDFFKFDSTFIVYSKIKTSTSSLDIVDQLNSLNELYKSGVLTKEEFEKAKKKILN